MNKKKLLSVVLAALMVVDVVCFGLTAIYHATECDAANASVSFEVIDAPTGEYISTDVIIVDYAYESVVAESAPKIYSAGMRFDTSNYSSDPMVFENMFPGDHVSKTYKVNISRQNPVSLWFRVDIQDDPIYDKLAEVLMLKVSVNGQEIYDGLMKDFGGHNSGFPSFYEDVIVQSLEYHIEVYLDTSVGNEYMQKPLKCDYSWTIYENMPDPVPPGGGGSGDAGDDGDTTDKDNPVDDDDKDGVEVVIPDESHENFETFVYIPEPCHFGIACVIYGAAFLVLLASLILIRRKENGLEK